MYEPNVVQGCDSMVGSIAIIAIIVTAFTTMLGLVKPADTVKVLRSHCGDRRRVGPGCFRFCRPLVEHVHVAEGRRRPPLGSAYGACGGNSVSHGKKKKRGLVRQQDRQHAVQGGRNE